MARRAFNKQRMDRFKTFAGKRRGSILIQSALVLPVVLIFCSFIVDLGHILVVHAELQNAADSAALAASNQVLDDRIEFIRENPSFIVKDFVTGETVVGDLPSTFYDNARATAVMYALKHKAGAKTLGLSSNPGNDSGGDVVFGRYQGPNMPLDLSDPVRYDSVRVVVRRDDQVNGSVGLFFARMIGITEHEASATAQATFVDALKGFTTPPEGQKSSIIPFAVSREAWDRIMKKWQEGDVEDQYHADPDSTDVTKGVGDGIPEFNMFPGAGASDTNITEGLGHVQVTPGNFGTVNVGTNNNSTSHLRDLILDGPSQADFDFHGGQLSVKDGPINLSGDPGLSAGMDSALQAILGETRTILIYDKVEGQGNTTVYRIVDFAPVRILDANFNGKNKGITIQPDFLSDGGGEGGGEDPDYSLMAPPGLTQ